MTHLVVRVLILRYLLSQPELHFIFLGFSWTPMAPRWAKRRVLTPPWSFGFGFLNWNERNFEFLGVKKDERKLLNERRWHEDWNDAEDDELEKRRGNLGTEDGTCSKCAKMILLFILKVDYHISHYWVLKMLLCWDEKPKAQFSQIIRYITFNM